VKEKESTEENGYFLIFDARVEAVRCRPLNRGKGKGKDRSEMESEVFT